MTTIAFDGTTLAADRGCWCGGVRTRVRKVHRIRRGDRVFLVAFTGAWAYCSAVHQWMLGKLDRPNPRDFFELSDINDEIAVVVNEARRVYTLSASLIYMPFAERRFASGSGFELAWGAMEAGASAAQAVRIAMRRSDYAGFGVDTVRL